MLDIWTVVLFVTVLVLVRFYRAGRKPAGMPPGPPTLPFFGNLNLLHKSDKLHVTTAELGKKYNGLFSLQHSIYSGLMITDFAIAKEAFTDQADVFSDRALHLDFVKAISKEMDKGLMLRNGEGWKQLKRLALQSMRDSGVGKAAMEGKIQEETNELIKWIEQQDGKYFTFEMIFNKSVTNVICAVLFDRRYSYDDPAYNKLIQSFNSIIRLSGYSNVFPFLPWWTFILMPFIEPGVVTAFKHIDAVKAFIKQSVVEHRESFDKDNIRDFVDVYLQAQLTEGSHRLSDIVMFETILQMFVAGSETTSTTLLWVIVFLTKHTEVQDKCRREITKNIGDRQVSYKDRIDLPYLEATICEVMRIANTVPVLPIVHNTRTSTVLHGYTIPKDTLVQMNMYAIHMDPKLWENPRQFKPERFLDKNGNFFKPETFIPFGMGRRACLGEQLAKMELFLFVAELLQKFEFQAEDKSKLPCPDDTKLGVTLIPEEFYVKAVKIT